MKAANQPWIISARFDCAFILAPALAVSAVALLFFRQLEIVQDMPPWLWLMLVVGVDAGHVYATLFRTYLVRSELERHQALFTLTPLLAWLAGSLLYSIDSLLFWRALAYLAVFHFVRQQYGFMMIYARQENYPAGWYRLLDKAAIYSATLFPLIFWHCRGRSFSWFIDGDLLIVDAEWLWQSAALIYLGVLAGYFIKEGRLWKMRASVNLPRNLLLMGTASSWFIGIVAFDNDLVFTATNVIAHGIPYFALVWGMGYRQNAGAVQTKPAYLFKFLSDIFRWQNAPLYILILFSLAYFEEGIWDGLIWRDHPGLFQVFFKLPPIVTEQTLTWLVPLLALPQATHYILDAFIWRMRESDSGWKQILLVKRN